MKWHVLLTSDPIKGNRFRGNGVTILAPAKGGEEEEEEEDEEERQKTTAKIKKQKQSRNEVRGVLLRHSHCEKARSKY